MIFDLHDRIELLELLPKGGIVAEVGVLTGGYSQHIYDIVRPKELHLIDRWERVWSDGVEQDINDVLASVHEKFDRYDNVFLHRMDSVEASKKFPNKFFDWVYIDAGHFYESIKADIKAYTQKTKRWIAGHDFVSGDLFGTGVIRAVVEAIQEDGLKMIALTSHDDIPRKEGQDPAFPWEWADGKIISYVLEIPRPL